MARDAKFWINLARAYATESKDPSTKVGAVIVRPDGTFCSAGMNGFPRGIADTEDRLNDRPVKYSLTIHAELNAILFARCDLKDHTIYCTFSPCSNCALSIIQSGIKKVYCPRTHENERWAADQDEAAHRFAEAGVEIFHVDMDDWR